MFWKIMLSIVTAASFLHLFELPGSKPAQSGSGRNAPNFCKEPVEVAFSFISPSVEITATKILILVRVQRLYVDRPTICSPRIQLSFPIQI